MYIIPVIDLKDGVVVHAKQGQREHYAPISSPLCSSSDLDRVITAYLSLHAFTTFYIADLNAIAGDHCHQALLGRLLDQHPHLTFWIDSGFQSAPTLYQQYANYWPVLGSESYTAENYIHLARFQKRYILSLDFSATMPLGATEIFTSPTIWPKHVILMTLQRVGSNHGPDFEKLHEFMQNFPEHQFIAAGGIRHASDVNALNQMGVHSALLASALHAGAISATELQVLQKNNGAL